MKRFAAALALASVLAWTADAAWASAAKPTKDARRRARSSRPRSRKKYYRLGSHAEIDRVCQLSDEQKQNVVELRAKRDQALSEFRTDSSGHLRALQDDLKNARRRKDEEAVKGIQAEISEILVEEGDIRRKCDADVWGLLTAMQRDRWNANVIANYLKSQFRGFKFSAEQMTKIKAAYNEQAGGTPMNDRAAQSKALEGIKDHIRDEVITDRQRTDAALAPLLRMLRPVKLTDEQNARIRAAYTKLLKEKKSRRSVLGEVRSVVEKEILTEDQRITLAVRQVLWYYRNAKVTPEQQAWARAVYVKHTAGAKMSHWKARQEALKKVHQEVYREVLTDEQRKDVRLDPKYR